MNRSTAAEMSDQAFQQAIVPTARLLAEHLTRDAISKRLGWSDLEFVFTDVMRPAMRWKMHKFRRFCCRTAC